VEEVNALFNYFTGFCALGVGPDSYCGSSHRDWSGYPWLAGFEPTRYEGPGSPAIEGLTADSVANDPDSARVGVLTDKDFEGSDSVRTYGYHDKGAAHRFTGAWLYLWADPNDPWFNMHGTVSVDKRRECHHHTLGR